MQIVEKLPVLWECSENQNLFRASIIVLLTRIVDAMGKESSVIHPFVAPVIQHSVDLHGTSHVYLMEDALDLWLAVMNNAPASSPPIFQLFPSLLALLDITSENLKIVLRIAECYVVLGCTSTMATYAAPLFGKFQDIMVDLVPQATTGLIRVVDVFLQAFPREMGILVPLFEKFLESILMNEVRQCPVNGHLKDNAHYRLILRARSCFFPSLHVSC